MEAYSYLWRSMVPWQLEMDLAAGGKFNDPVSRAIVPPMESISCLRKPAACGAPWRRMAARHREGFTSILDGALSKANLLHEPN
jgi:hypothetical protein